MNEDEEEPSSLRSSEQKIVNKSSQPRHLFPRSNIEGTPEINSQRILIPTNEIGNAYPFSSFDVNTVGGFKSPNKEGTFVPQPSTVQLKEEEKNILDPPRSRNAESPDQSSESPYKLHTSTLSAISIQKKKYKSKFVFPIESIKEYKCKICLKKYHSPVMERKTRGSMCCLGTLFIPCCLCWICYFYCKENIEYCPFCQQASDGNIYYC